MAVLSTLYSFLTWRNAAILLALLNLKSLPMVWHLRITYYLFGNWTHRHQVLRILKTHQGPTHPLFAPVTISSRSPIAEIDYNMHKSNGTYFTDLDAARTAIFIRTFSSGYTLGFQTLDKEGKRGNLRPILGSVHSSFKQEIGAYQKYKIVSRIIGWDSKWLIIGCWFTIVGKDGQPDEVCASCLSKYVIKKGRYTVPPELALQVAGWLPPKPGSAQQAKPTSVVSASGRNLGAPIPPGLSNTETDTNLPGREWDWIRVEQYRKRGVEMAQGWLNLDTALLDEYNEYQRTGA